MKFLFLCALLLCCATTFASSLEDEPIELASTDRFEDEDIGKYLPESIDEDFDTVPPEGVDEGGLFADLIERVDDEDFDFTPNDIEDIEDEFPSDSLERFKPFPIPEEFQKKKEFKKKKFGKRKRKPRFSKRLKVQLKAFRSGSGAAIYKYYVLQGNLIRHYRVTFSQTRQSRFRKSAQRRTRRCIIRKYRRRCLRLKKLFKKGRCTDKVAKECSGDFETFERADPRTLGKNKVKPPKRLKVQLKAFRSDSGAAIYKYYVLQGNLIRHYRVTFSQSQQFRFRKSAQRKTRRCIIREYRRRCLRLKKLFKKGRCTDKVAKECSGDFETFERANPKTFGKNKVKPKRKPKRKPRKPEPPIEEPPIEEPPIEEPPIEEPPIEEPTGLKPPAPQGVITERRF